jgi:hypothetical protein
VLTSLKLFVKPAFMRALEAWTHLRWRRRKIAARHGLPHRLVVSLTSYPKRYDVLELTLKTILMQDQAPDAVVLWIAHNDIAALPASIRNLEQDGLTIRATDDLRSYKKILPALEHYGDAIIVTADDDVYYPPFWLRRLTEEYRVGVPEVLCHRAHRTRKSAEGFEPYDRWDFNIRTARSAPDVFFVGVGGVLYPPGTLRDEARNISKILELCPTTDDVWLNWMVRLDNTPVRRVGGWIRFYEWAGSQEVALQNSNRGGSGGNDAQIANLIRVYGIPEASR